MRPHRSRSPCGAAFFVPSGAAHRNGDPRVPGILLQGKSNPYTSHNGPMFSFLGKDDAIATDAGQFAELLTKGLASVDTLKPQ